MIRAKLFALALATLTISAQAQDVKVEKYKLSNGLTVILHEDHTVPLATINTWFYVGSKDEQERRSGFAHLFEHLMFMGTERVPGSQFDLTMEENGGWNNASTSEERTNYYSFGPSNLLKTLLWLDADRLEDLGRLMDQKKLDLQREVVRNERRQNTELQPYGEAYERLPNMLFPKGHPYHNSVIGSHEDLQAASVQDVKDFYATFYIPNNASLVVAGDFDPAEVKAYIATAFGTLPRQSDPPRKDIPASKINGVRKAMLVDDVAFAKTIMAWHSPGAYKSGDIEMSLAAKILTDGVSSRLYQKLVVEKQISTEVGAYQNSLMLGSYFMLEANVAAGATIEQVEKAIDETVAEFAKTGPTAEELKRQSAAAQTGILSSLQSIASKADKLNEYQFYWGEPNSFKRDLDRIKSVTSAGMAAVVLKALDANSRVIIRVIPKSPQADRMARDTKPTLGAETAFTVPTPTEFTLSNGIPVQYFHRPDVPLMHVQAVVDYGSDHDSADKAGLASSVAEMATSGTGTLDAKAFQSQLELLGASVSASAGRTKTTIAMETISTNFELALRLFAGALAKPSFLPKEWDRIQKVRISDIQASLEDPASISSLVATREYFGVSNPAGRSGAGTEASVKSLTLNDVKAAYAVYGTKTTMLFAAGNLSPEMAKASMERALASWIAGNTLPKPTYERKAEKGLQIFVVDVPDSAQTVVRFMMPSVPYADPKRLEFTALGTVLGGTFTSRLNANLRENKGYTYGANSRYDFRNEFGFLVSGASVRADATGASLKEFLSEFAKIREGDISEAEARKAKSSIKADLVNDFASIGGVVGAAAELAEYGKKLSSVQDDLASLDTIAPAGLNSLANGGVDLENGILVIVGDQKLILEQIKGLGLPEPKIVKS